MGKYKRSIFVINPAYQYKFSLFICIIVFIGSLIYPITIYELYGKIISLQPGKAAQFSSSREDLLLLLSVIQFAFLGIIFVVSIFMSHKTAGPMYKLQNYLRDIHQGGEIKGLYFRGGDNFSEIADEVNQTMDYLTEQRENDFEYLGEVSSYIANLALVVPEDKKPVLNEILSNLAKIQSEHKRV